MRLKRIVAERFGRLDSATLGDLGPGLNVVLGPNEAGKTSFSTLVRHVLYGYPTKRDSEAGYESNSGKRLGRLVFIDDAGEWAVERAEGSHGGPIAVHALSGSERPGLLDSVTQGVSRDAFRIVFGFGLEELAAIEAKRGSGDDILSPLYAAQVGMASSPADVRRELASEADGLWVKKGSTRKLNEVKSQIKDVRSDLAQLEAEAARYAGERREFEELGVQLAQARADRDRLVARASTLASATQRIEDLQEREREAEEQARTAAEVIDSANAEATEIEVDEQILSVASKLDALLADISLFKDRLARVDDRTREAASARASATGAIEAAGLTVDEAESADVGPATEKGIEAYRDKLAELTSLTKTSGRAADVAADALGAANQTSSSVGTIKRNQATVLPGSITGLLGVAVAVIGLLDEAWAIVGLGATVLLVGIALVLQAMRRPQDTTISDERVEDFRRQSDAARSTAQRDADALGQARGEWNSWLEQRGLARAGEDPAAAALLVSSVKEYRVQLSQAQAHESAAADEMRGCEEYRQQLADATVAFLPELAVAQMSDVPMLAAQVQEALGRTRESDAARQKANDSIEQARHDAESATQKAQMARAEQAELMQTHGAGSGDAHTLASEAELAQCQAGEATEAHDDIAREHAMLKGGLDSDGHDANMAELRLSLTGLEERREELLEEYAVLAVAERLMTRTQEYSEQARQPAVVKRASEIFEQITSGRYTRVAPPSEDGRFRVFDAASEAKDTEELSTGTAQQLYLAVRMALVEQLDEMGEGLPVLMDDVLVNFDPERRAGTARAVAELARHRQVVLFTCHPEVAALFSQIDSGLTEITLDRC